MKQRNAIILSVVLSVVAVFVVVPLAIGTASDLGAWVSMMERTKYLDENFKNPVIGSDGKAREGSDPCAMSPDPAGCDARMAEAAQRNAVIQAKNLETYLSIPQHEDPTVTPRWNYWYEEQKQLLETYIEENDCDYILRNIESVKDYWEKLGPTAHSEGDNKLILDAIQQYEQAAEKHCQ